MKPSLMRKPPARAIASRSGTAQWCSSRMQRGGGVVRDVLDDVPRLLVGEHADAVGRRLGARFGAGVMPSSPSMPRPISAPTLLPSSIASSLERLLRCATSISPSASLCTASASITRTVSLSLQALQLGDDLAVELRVLEAEHDELNRSDGHGPPPRSRVALTVTSHAQRRIARMG